MNANPPTHSPHYPPLSPLTTSPSYIHPTTTLPTHPPLLSRPSSQTRLRLRPTSHSSPALHTYPAAPPSAKKRSFRTPHDVEEDWVTRTASALALSRLEEKGQSWLVARGSSTSLRGGDGEDEGEGEGEGVVFSTTRWDGLGERSAGGSRQRLQGRSRVQSRRGSVVGGGKGGKEEDVRPDFVDVRGEEEEEDGGEEVDEGEMKRVVMGRVGGWVDWAVGWMDFRGEGEEGGEEEGEEDEDGVGGVVGGEDKGVYGRGGLDAVELQRRLRRKKRRDDEAECGVPGTNAVSSAPEDAGIWSDAKWFLGVATKGAL